MAKTVVGLFDDGGTAREVVRALEEAGFARDRVSLVSKSAGGGAEVTYVEEDGREQVEDMAKGAGTGAAIGGAAGLLLGLSALAIPGIGPVLAAGPLAAAIAGAGVGATAGGLISGLKRLGVEDDDADKYAEGIKRGGTLVSVDAPDGMSDRAVGVMKSYGAVEIDKRAAGWREEGWTGFDSSETADAFAAFASASETTAEYEPVRARGTSRDEIAVPVVEEQLEVGKREVERGGVRVHSRVSETPVEEDVRLREERLRVERLETDYTFHGAESEAFKEGMIEVKEAYEELIVKKKPRVVEEVVIAKDVEERTETVRETLRRTDVEVEQLEPERARGASARSDDAAAPRGGERDRD